MIAAGSDDVRVVVGPGVAVDLPLLRETVAAECAALQAEGRVETVADPARFEAALIEAAGQPRSAVVALPGPDPAARRLLADPNPYAGQIVWCDLTQTSPTPAAGGAVQLYGRGLAGVGWAVRHVLHRLRWPAQRISYGEHPEQWGELRRPSSGTGPYPVVVLLHGGFWRSMWAADLMDALAVDLAERGLAAWNLEYRRPDQHGWEATTADVAAGLATLASPPASDQLDLGRVAVVGHSAGGQLALRVAADSVGQPGHPPAGGVPVALAVALAGVVGLAEASHRWLGNGAVDGALGGTPAQLPEVYAAADPHARLPLRVPQLLVMGRQDDLDLIDLNRQYAAVAQASGDDLTYLEQPGDHFSVIAPGSSIWQATAVEITQRLAGA